jgi:hypothetical protein
LTNNTSCAIIKIQRNTEKEVINKMKTINDYMAMVKALRELGQQLVEQQYNECDDVAAWVDEVENMDMHLECCLSILVEDCGVEEG